MAGSRRFSLLLCAALALMWCTRLKAQVDRPPGLLSDLVDISGDFHEYRNTYFLADKLAQFDPASGVGAIAWTRNQLYPRIAFDNMENVLQPFAGVTFPEGEYAVNPSLPFSIQFVSPRAVRIRIRTGPQVAHTSATFARGIARSCSAIPPLMLRCGFGRTCFFTIITCSTSTRPSSGDTRNTRPSFPVSRPVITFTVSFRRISTRLCSVDTVLIRISGFKVSRFHSFKVASLGLHILKAP